LTLHLHVVDIMILNNINSF